MSAAAGTAVAANVVRQVARDWGLDGMTVEEARRIAIDAAEAAATTPAEAATVWTPACVPPPAGGVDAWVAREVAAGRRVIAITRRAALRAARYGAELYEPGQEPGSGMPHVVRHSVSASLALSMLWVEEERGAPAWGRVPYPGQTRADEAAGPCPASEAAGPGGYRAVALVLQDELPQWWAAPLGPTGARHAATAAAAVHRADAVHRACTADAPHAGTP